MTPPAVQNQLVAYGMTKKRAAATVRLFAAALGDVLALRGRASVRGVGTWRVVPAADRPAYDWRTRRPMFLSGRSRLAFKSSRGLRKAAGVL